MVAGVVKQLVREMTSSFVTKTALALLMGLSVPIAGLAQSSETNTEAETSTEAEVGTETGTETEPGTETETGTDTETGTEAEMGAETGTDVEGEVTTEEPAMTTEGGASVEVDISTEQQTEIRTVIQEVQVEPVAEVDFDVSIGSSAPDTITLTPLPARVIEIVPQYAGFLFFILPDGRIVIVAPSTLEIVYILG